MAPDTHLGSVNYLKNILKSTPHSIPINITKPTPAAKQIVEILSSLTAASRMLASWSMVILFPRKIRGQTSQKRKSEIAKVDIKDCENTYGIDHLKIGDATHDYDYSE